MLELTEKDISDPALADALSRLREVRLLVILCLKVLLKVCVSVFPQVLMYTVPGGKRNRGLSVIGSLRELLPPSELTQDLVQRALLVGWCIELVRRATFHIAALI